MDRIHFVLGAGTYPHITGGMEIFNYYLIQSLKDKFNISYTASHSLDIPDTKQIRSYKIRPTKYIFPIQLFFHLLFAKDARKVVFSYSASHAILWNLYHKICKLLNRKYYAVIHYGELPPKGQEEVYRRFFNNAEVVVAVSEDIKRNYDAKYGINCKVIYPLVPFSIAKLSKEDLKRKFQIPIKSNVICMVGSLKGMKNPDTIIEAIKLFTEEEKKNYSPYIVFAGDGVSMDSLKQKVIECGLENCVTFLGNVPKEKVNEVYKLSDYYLIASDFEGTSISLLEAMFNRKAIITSRVPGIVNTITEGKECLMYDVKNATQLRQCLLSYLQHPELANKLSSKAYDRYLHDYNYDNVVAEYTKIFNS